MLYWPFKRSTKDEILHGIYLDNLKTFGSPVSLARQQAVSRLARGLVIALVAAPALLLGNSGVPDQPWTYALPASRAVPAVPSPDEWVDSPAIFRLPEQPRQPIASDTDTAGGNKAVKDLPSLRKLFGLSVQTIVIDAGHGGIDPGTSGRSGVQEKTVTLDIARQLKKQLEATGRYKVLMTREDDSTMPLKKRVEFANSQGADLFISIHINYVPNKPNNLIETYYYGVPDSAHGIELAERENQGSSVTLSEFTDMAEKLNNKLKLDESRRLASEIQRSIYDYMDDNNKQVIDMGIRKGPFLVIMGTDMPAVLAEVTSISNPDEEKKLQSAEYRREIATRLEAGIVNYLNKGDYIYEAKR